MVFSLMSNPVSMIFSLLLMQGISLTMFRSFLNQAINRDPLRFSLNFGNQNNQSRSDNHGVPTPAPIVDPRVMDLLTLIRALTPSPNVQQQQQQHQLPVQASSVVPQFAPIMSAPIIALQHSAQPAVAQPTVIATQPMITQPMIAQPQVQQLIHQQPQVQSTMPQIIIVPQLMKTSASDQVSTVVKVKNQTEKENHISTENPSNVDKISLTDITEESDAENQNKPKRRPNNNKKPTKYRFKPDHGDDNLVIFEAVGVNFRHPNHKYDSDGNSKKDQEDDNVVNIRADYS